MGSKIALKNTQDQEFSITHQDNAGAISIDSSDIVTKSVTAVTDNTIPRFDGTTGKVQNSGVVIDDNSNVIVGSSMTTFSQGVSRGIAIEPTAPMADSEFRVNGSGSWFTSFSSNTSGAGFGGWRHIGSTGVIKNWVYTAGSGELQFGTNGAERMRIGASGNVMIGTTTDNGVDKLQVNGSISAPFLSGFRVLGRGDNTAYAGGYRTVKTVTTNGDGGANSADVYVNIKFGPKAKCIAAFDQNGNSVSPSTIIQNSNLCTFVVIVCE